MCYSLKAVHPKGALASPLPHLVIALSFPLRTRGLLSAAGEYTSDARLTVSELKVAFPNVGIEYWNLREEDALFVHGIR